LLFLPPFYNQHPSTGHHEPPSLLRYNPSPIFPLLTLNPKTTLYLSAVFLIREKETCTLALTQPHKTPSSPPIQTIDFIYENTPVKIIINRNHPEIQLAGLKIGPYEEGKEYEVKYWIAHELEKTGIARLREEEQLDSVKLHKISWKESIQQTRQLSPIQEDFYPKLRRYLTQLKRSAIGNPDKLKEHEKTTRLAHDIVTIRLKKIVSLASSPEQTNQTLKDLATEERILYQQLHKIVNNWKTKILKAADET